MYYGYSPYGIAAWGPDSQAYGSQHYQYPSTYNKQQNSTAKQSGNGKTEKWIPLPQGDVTTNGVDGVKDQKDSNLPLKADRNVPASDGSYGLSKGRSGNYQGQTNWSAYPYYSSQMFSDNQQNLPNNCNSTISNTRSKGQPRNQNLKSYPHHMVCFPSRNVYQTLLIQ
jgi:YTH domain-containing family protein